MFFIFTQKTPMRLIINLFFTALFVIVLSYVMPGITVDNFGTALIVAIVLGLLNMFIKPLLVLFTLPVTIFTLGLFLLVINGIIIMLCAELVEGFHVRGFLRAMLFSLVLSFCQSLMSSLSSEKS